MSLLQRFRSRLSVKLTLPILLISTLVLIVNFSVIYIAMSQWVTQNTERETEYLLDTLIIAAETNTSRSNLYRVVNSLASNDNIVHLRIIKHPENIIVADNHHQHVGKLWQDQSQGPEKALMQNSAIAKNQSSANTFYTARKVRLINNVQNKLDEFTILLAYDMTAVKYSIQQVLLKIAAVFLLGTLILLIGVYIVQTRLLIHPILSLVHTIRKQKHSEKLLLNDLVSNDELGDLSSHYNDLTKERHTALAELKEQNQRTEDAILRMKLATEAGGIAVWEQDLISGDMICDSRMHALYGFSDNELKHSQQWINRVHPDDQVLISNELSAAISEQRLFDIEFRVLLPNAEIRYIKAVAKVFDDENGIAHRMIGTNCDITEQHRFEATILESKNTAEKLRGLAEKAAEMKSNFLSSMSHEVRTPMNGMLGMAELLETTALDKTQKSYVRTMQRSANTLMIVINDILDYSKIEAGKLELNHQAFNLAELIDESVMPYEIKANQQVTLNVELDKLVPQYLLGDAARLHQVIINLLNNAFKFTDIGTISLQIKCLNVDTGSAHLAFSISDTGVGISDVDQAKLFQPFTQVDQSSGRQHGGTGLGLSICKQLIELMGGNISLHSVYGKGTTFSFTLEFPVVESVEKEQDAESINALMPDLHILLVEDNLVNQMVMQEYMKKLGVQLTTVADGYSAVEIICNQERYFDLILMDCEMPGIDGYETTTRIRDWENKNSRTALTIYALTAHVLPENILKCKNAGMNEHLSKPVKIKTLQRIFSEFSSSNR
ncbi:MAG: response regulator [Pseudomonadales bacterium]|nr:response regulator [Pseudomonadales bacterium]